MTLILGLAAKSLLITGATLLLLRLFRDASASQRSWLAHAGLGALLLMPVASWLMPVLTVRTRLLGDGASAALPVASEAPMSVTERIAQAPFAPAALDIDWSLVAYAVPALLLLAVTVLALVRLFALRARAEVMVEPQWLSALAHAQHRMAFKSGTALLVSDALPSPISWGLARPTILLNQEALAATNEAEAIIAHELAHVASLDWAKLLLGRVVTALYWFNPLVWILARDAHQLREEAADDAVLAANVNGPDYAALLVHTARHDCKAALLTAHGVAPAKGSLQRRVHRVLDQGLPRTRMEARWATIGALVALLGVAPLAALTFAPAHKAEKAATPLPATAAAQSAKPVAAVAPVPAQETSPSVEAEVEEPLIDLDVSEPRIAALAERGVNVAMRGWMQGPDEDFVAEAKRAYPPFAGLNRERFRELEVLGIDAEDLQGLWNAGLRNLTMSEIGGALVVGADADFIKGLTRAGCPRLTIRQYTELAALGLDPDDVRTAIKRGAQCNPHHLALMARYGLGAGADELPPPPPPAPPPPAPTVRAPKLGMALPFLSGRNMVAIL